MSDFYEDLEVIRVHKIALGCLLNVFPIKFPKKSEHIFFKIFRIFLSKIIFSSLHRNSEKRHCNLSKSNKVSFETFWPYFENNPRRRSQWFKPKIMKNGQNSSLYLTAKKFGHQNDKKPSLQILVYLFHVLCQLFEKFRYIWSGRR
jgi:hypothetical protein